MHGGAYPACPRHAPRGGGVAARGTFLLIVGKTGVFLSTETFKQTGFIHGPLRAARDGEGPHHFPAAGGTASIPLCLGHGRALRPRQPACGRQQRPGGGKIHPTGGPDLSAHSLLHDRNGPGMVWRGRYSRGAALCGRPVRDPADAGRNAGPRPAVLRRARTAAPALHRVHRRTGIAARMGLRPVDQRQWLELRP